jgi:spore germination protein GerM
MRTVTVVAVILLLAAAAFVAFFAFRRETPPVEEIITTPAVEEKEATHNIYFSNAQLNTTPEDCSVVFPVERQVTPAEAPARPTLEALLGGPTADERELGYVTNINPGTMLNSITIEEGVAYADFNERLDEGVAGSCRVIAIRSQITQTLMQFPTVTNVVISVDGESEEILQP